jgi:hypothetical protein
LFLNPTPTPVTAAGSVNETVPETSGKSVPAQTDANAIAAQTDAATLFKP